MDFSNRTRAAAARGGSRSEERKQYHRRQFQPE